MLSSVPLPIMKTLSPILPILLCLFFISSDALECLPLQINDTSSHTELLTLLTDPCRYDLLIRPPVNTSGPLIISAQMYIYYLQVSQTSNLQFQVQILVQFHWLDSRLAYRNISSLPQLMAQADLLDRLWFPHIDISNEDQTSITGLASTDQTVFITPDGGVYYSTRIHTTLVWQSEAGHFPFDTQNCHLVLDNWRYNLSYVSLQWVSSQPVNFPSVMSSLTEFDLVSLDTITSDNFKENSDSFVTSTVAEECSIWSDGWSKQTQDVSSNSSACGVRKSSLVVAFKFSRKSSFYFWDYYMPSIVLVCTSWGTFWVDPEVIPARVWLATYNMLGFFGLSAMNDAMPKLSHLKMNDIWFIGCNLFIFLSLAEFAFVNIVHRQETKHIPLKRASSKYILKSSLMTETVSWKNKAASCPSSPELRQQRKNALAASRKQQKSVAFDLALEDLTTNVRMRRQLSRRRQAFAGTHMTNKQMANWIDNRSRALFPIAFVIFNGLFWLLMLL